MPRLSSNQIHDALTQLPDWQYDKDKNAIVRQVMFQTYMDGIEFVNTLAKIAEKHQHHPDLNVGYGQVKIQFTTHDSDGVTDKDIMMAKQVEDILY